MDSGREWGGQERKKWVEKKKMSKRMLFHWMVTLVDTENKAGVVTEDTVEH